MNGKVPSQGVRELQACKESAGLLGCIPGCNGAGGGGVSQHAFGQGCVYATMQLGRGCDGGVHPQDTPPHLSTSGRYASYWNAFLFHRCLSTGGGVVCIHGVVCLGGLHPGGAALGGGVGQITPQVCVREWGVGQTSRGLHPEGGWAYPPAPGTRKASGTYPTGMLSCYRPQTKFGAR